VASLIAAAALAAPAFGQTAPETGAAGAAGQADVTVEPKADCHREMFYKLQEQGKTQIAAEQARFELTRFHQDVGGRLQEAASKERTRQLEAQREEFRRCLKEKRRPSLLCTAMATRDETLCPELLSAADRETCALVIPAATAWAAAGEKRCGELKTPDVRRLCEFAESGRFECDRITSEPLQAACNVALVQKGAAAGLSLLPEEHRAAVSWVLAVQTRESSWCEANPYADHVQPCKALVAGDTAPCPPTRATVEPVDRDWSCRNPLIYQAVHPVAGGSEAVAVLASSYPGRADCVVTLELRAQGQRLQREMGRTSLDEKHESMEFRTLVGAEEVVAIAASCNWDPATSKFLVKEGE
jgi:hypothetical protein